MWLEFVLLFIISLPQIICTLLSDLIHNLPENYAHNKALSEQLHEEYLDQLYWFHHYEWHKLQSLLT